jgi:hypothetical protein
MMTQEERTALEQEWEEITLRLSGDFVNPKDLRRKDEITSLLMTDGESPNIKFNFVKGRGGNKGLNSTKPYSRKGKVG